MANIIQQKVMMDVPEIAPFDPTKKKKKKKKKETTGACVSDDSLHSLVKRADVLSCVEDEKEDSIPQQSSHSREEIERDYKYEELVQRIFCFLRENNLELGGDKRRTVLGAPEVITEGSAHTVLVNLLDLCKTMQRQPEHVMTFMSTKLRTSGTLDGENRFVVRGRFVPTDFEASLQSYIDEYVLCHCCRSPDTVISKQNRIRVFFLRCDMCGSERSVAPVETGHLCRVGRRKAGLESQ